MRRVTALLGAAAVVGLMATTFAQGTNFSGTWTRDAAAAPAGGAAAAGGGGGQRGGGAGRGGGGGGAFACGMECTITQDAKTLTIKRPAGANGQALPDVVLNLTGVTKQEVPGRGEGAAPTVLETNAKWDGAKWVLTRVQDMQGTSITSTTTVSIEGGKLTVVTTSTREGAMPQTATYTKK